MSGVQTVLECAKESSGKIAGVDICGEADERRYMRMKPMIMQMKNCWRFLKVYLGNPTVNNK